MFFASRIEERNILPVYCACVGTTIYEKESGFLCSVRKWEIYLILNFIFGLKYNEVLLKVCFKGTHYFSRKFFCYGWFCYSHRGIKLKWVYLSILIFCVFSHISSRIHRTRDRMFSIFASLERSFDSAKDEITFDSAP